MLVARACALTLILAGGAGAQVAPPAQDAVPAQPAPQPVQPPQPGGKPQQVPWPVQLGMRVVQVEQSFPLIDRAVLVPDAATYLESGRPPAAGRCSSRTRCMRRCSCGGSRRRS
jgi:hypothetical protein